MTATVLNTKIGEVENEIPNVNGLVKKQVMMLKYQTLKKKYFTASDYNKFASDILDDKIKQKELVNKSDIFNLVKKSDLDTKLKHQQ